MVTQRIHVYYSGDVQGVGFRFTAERLASSLALTGWVRNLSDGRVELLCEGPEPSLGAFLGKIREIFGRYITDTAATRSRATGEFGAFTIRP